VVIISVWTNAVDEQPECVMSSPELSGGEYAYADVRKRTEQKQFAPKLRSGLIVRGGSPKGGASRLG